MVTLKVFSPSFNFYFVIYVKKNVFNILTYLCFVLFSIRNLQIHFVFLCCVIYYKNNCHFLGGMCLNIFKIILAKLNIHVIKFLPNSLDH